MLKTWRFPTLSRSAVLARLISAGIVLLLIPGPATLVDGAEPARSSALPAPKKPGPAAQSVMSAKTSAWQEYQYQFEKIRIPPARADEPQRASWSPAAAEHYLDQAAAAWSGKQQCISCHTNGTYLTHRPALTAQWGPPDSAQRDFALDQLGDLQTLPFHQQQRSTTPATVIYIAAGLAEWDAHVTGKLSPETDEALKFMFSLQRESGAWGSLTCWPPFESSAFQGATVAARAVGTAPGWLATQKDPVLLGKVAKLREYLRTVQPQQEYDRSLLLGADARWPGLLVPERKRALIQGIFDRQNADGGWSIHAFGKPEEWGDGGRAKKLRAEPEFQQHPSDGHQTGLAIILLRESGIVTEDARLQRGIAWLKKNQRESGRWWTRSLNTDRWHFITYSGTMYSVRALALCNALPGRNAASRPVPRK